MKDLYEQLDVSQQVADGMKIYRCFKSCSTGKFFVQSCDYFTEPLNSAQLEHSNLQMLELFSEENIQARTNGFHSLHEAIHNFDCDFENK